MQTNLEKVGISTREETLVRNEYVNSEGNVYGVNHPNALSDGDVKGKGSVDAGYTHTVPNQNSNENTKNRITPQLSTEDGGGKYDIEGINKVGGRNYLQAINIYGPTKEYGSDLIDTNLNRQNGQVVL